MSHGPRQIVERRRPAAAAPPQDTTKPVAVHAPADIARHRTKISIKNLTFFYGAAEALRRVTLDIPEKQVTGLIGPSGCGKSTLLRVLNRLYDMYPDERVTGEVLLDGKSIFGPEVDLNLLRWRIGMVFQGPTPFPMSIFENVAFGPRSLENLSHRNTADRLEESLTRAAVWSEVKDRLSAGAGSLSVGQQQRLCIARCLGVDPEVVLMDEPASALDPIATSKIEDLIEALKKEYTVVIVTHSMQQAARISDNTAFFLMGELLETDTTATIFTKPKDKRTEDYITGRYG